MAAAEKSKKTSSSSKLAVLLALYTVQGLPFGFQSKCLPLYLRSLGYSLAAVSFGSLISVPWMAKVLWAPLVDQYSPWGLLKSSNRGLPSRSKKTEWIFLTQTCLFILCLAASQSSTVGGLVASLFCMNLAAATHDIAVDGLAVEILSSEELGYGNTAQVVGYKVGMLLGGGILLWFVQEVLASDLSLIFLIMAALVLVLLLPIILVNKSFQSSPRIASPNIHEETVLGTQTSFINAKSSQQQQASCPAEDRSSVTPKAFSSKMREFYVPLKECIAATSTAALALIATYKSGEAMADMMFKPMLIDGGFHSSTIALWSGVHAMLFSIGGSFVGGRLVQELSFETSLFLAFLMRLAPQAMRLYLALSIDETVNESLLAFADFAWVSICVESFFGGLLTTCFFAWMMSLVRRDLSSTHYTYLATIEVIGKSTCSVWSGLLAEAYGYPFVFLVAFMISASALPLLYLVTRGRTKIVGGLG